MSQPQQDVDWCWACCKVEHGDGFRCGECGHLYSHVPTGSFCEECLHDF